jgi:hypothetical protein
MANTEYHRAWRGSGEYRGMEHTGRLNQRSCIKPSAARLYRGGCWRFDIRGQLLQSL